MEMGDPTQLQLLVAAAQTKMEAKEECWQLLTVDEATYHSWKILAHSQSLLSDSLVAKFLLQHYEKTSCMTLTECFKCCGPLSLYCVRCNVYMGQPVHSTVSVHTNSVTGCTAAASANSDNVVTGCLSSTSENSDNVAGQLSTSVVYSDDVTSCLSSASANIDSIAERLSSASVNNDKFARDLVSAFMNIDGATGALAPVSEATTGIPASASMKSPPVPGSFAMSVDSSRFPGKRVVPECGLTSTRRAAVQNEDEDQVLESSDDDDGDNDDEDADSLESRDLVVDSDVDGFKTAKTVDSRHSESPAGTSRTSALENCNSFSTTRDEDKVSSVEDKDTISSVEDKDKVSSVEDKDTVSSVEDKDTVSSVSGARDASKTSSFSNRYTGRGRGKRKTAVSPGRTVSSGSHNRDWNESDGLAEYTIIVTDSSVRSGLTDADAAVGGEKATKHSSRSISTRSRTRNRNNHDDPLTEGAAVLTDRSHAGADPSQPASSPGPRQERDSASSAGRNLAAKVRVITDRGGGSCRKGEGVEAAAESEKPGRKSGRATRKKRTENGSPQRRKLRANKRGTKPAAYACPDCGEEFRTKCGRDSHLRKHRGERPYKCPQCPASYARSYQLSSHLPTHDAVKPHICSRCSKGFARLADLKVHEASHSALRPFVCDACGYASKTLSNLTLHKRIHDSSTRKAFVCSRCGEGFRRKFNFQRHVKTHDDVRPHECPHCPMRYVDKGSLKGHVERNHTVDRPRPYVCEICGTARFKRTEFEKHMMIHTGVRPYKCQVCGAAFIQANALKGHMKIHNDTEGKTNLCSLCGAAFKRYSSVKIHMKKVHRERVEDMETVEIHITQDAPASMQSPS